MKAGKRVLGLWIVLLVFASLLILPTYAANEKATLKLTSVEALPGEQFSTTLYVTDGSEISDFMIELLYDSDVVSLVSAKPNKDADGGVTINSDAPGVINVNYSNVENTYEEMPIADFVFKVDDNAGPGSYVFLRENPDERKQATRLDGNDYVDVPLECDFEDLSVFTSGDIDLNGSVEIRDVTHLRRYLARLEELTDYQLVMADAYYDNSVNVRDAVYIQQLLAKFDVQVGNRANVYFYDSDGTLYATKSVLIGEALNKVPMVPTKVGYGDGSWSTSRQEAKAPDFSNIKKDLKIYAYYGETPTLDEGEYAIEYHLYDNDTYLQRVGVTNPNPEKYKSSDGLTLQNLSVTGYTFDGWYDGEGSNAVQIKSIAKGETGSVALYAHWTAKSYSINYVCNLGNIPAGSYKVNESATLTVPTKDLVPEMANYIFMGWTDEDGNLVKSVPAGTTGNLKFTSNWTSRRNMAKPVSLGDPIICEDTENGTILFAYELGTIENVPLYNVTDILNAEGLKVITSQTQSNSLSTTDAKTIAKTVASATTSSQALTLAEDWNNTSSVTESYANQHGYTVEEANTLAKTSSNTYSLNTSKGAHQDYSNTGTTSAKLTGEQSHSEEHTTEKGWEINAGMDGKISQEGIPAVSPGWEVGLHVDGGYHKTTTDKTSDGWKNGVELSGSNSTTKSFGATWNQDESYSSSNSTSSSHTVSKALQEIVSETKGYGQSYSEGGSRSENRAFSSTDSSTDEYASTLTYFDSDVVTNSKTYETSGANAGKYRIVCAGTVHVFGVVGFDVATNSYYTYTYNVLDDTTTDFLDYSYDGTFTDYENAILPFEVPYFVHEYVTDRVLATEGLQLDDTTGIITDYYGDSDVVFVPAYISVDNNDGTKKSVKVTGIDKDAFQGKDIEAVLLSEFITEIPDSAFEGCTELKAIRCPGVTSIGDNAFKGCSKLEEMELSSAVTEVGEDAFEDVKKVTVRAANADVAVSVAKCKAKDITLNISEAVDTLAGSSLTVPEVTDSFALQGEGKNYSNLKVISDAGTTVINRVNFVDCSGIPLQISSEDLQLHSISVNSQGTAMLLKAESTDVGLYGKSNLSSGSKKTIVCRDMNLSAISQSIASKLNVNGDVLVWGDVTGESYLSFTDGEIKHINENEYNKYINGVFMVSFDPNGGIAESATPREVVCYESIGALPAVTREGYEFLGWYTEQEGGELVTEDYAFESVENVTLYAHWSVLQYTASWNTGNGYTIKVQRLESPYAGAEVAQTGVLGLLTGGIISSGDPVYYGDVLKVTYSASTGHSIKTKGATSITVTKDVTSSDIYATAEANDYPYNVVYKSSNGTNLGSTTVTKKYGTTNTITPPAKTGYTTPAPKSEVWDSTSAKTITFIYTPVSVSSKKTVYSGTWWSNGDNSITYNVVAEYRNRTATTVEIRLIWTNTISAYSKYGYSQSFNFSIGGGAWHDYLITTNSTWANSSSSARSVTITTEWETVSVAATKNTVAVSAGYWDNDGTSVNLRGATMTIPTY